MSSQSCISADGLTTGEADSRDVRGTADRSPWGHRRADQPGRHPDGQRVSGSVRSHRRAGRGHDRLDPHRSRHLRSAPRALRATVTTRRARRDRNCRRAARRRKAPIGIFSSVEVLPESACGRALRSGLSPTSAPLTGGVRVQGTQIAYVLYKAQICMRIEGTASGYPPGISAATWMRSVHRGPRSQVTPHTGDAAHR